MARVSDPPTLTEADVAFALRIAEAFGRGCPWLADECESAALVGLHDAWLRFDPGTGVRFHTFASHRVAGEIRDCLRRWRPRGFQRRGDAPRVSHFGGLEEPPEVAAGGPPVGRDLDHRDEVRGLARRLPKCCQAVFTAVLADGMSQVDAARACGVSEGRVSQILLRSRIFLAGQFPDHQDLFMRGTPVHNPRNATDPQNGTLDPRAEKLMAMRKKVSPAAEPEPEPETAAEPEPQVQLCPDCGNARNDNGRCYTCRPGGGKGTPREKTAKPAPTPADAELAAIAAMMESLGGLDKLSARRARDYVSARLKLDKE